MRVLERLGVGDFTIIQDTDYYRFTSDSVLLSRFVRAKKGETVADFCAGSGIVGLHFYAENKGVTSVTFFEIDEELSAMSKETIARNGLGEIFKAECMRVQDAPMQYAEKFSLIFCNPPYERGGFGNKNPEKAPCRKELSLTLQELCGSACRCLKFGGRFVLCHRADRLAEVLFELKSAKLEPKKLQLVSGKRGDRPYLVLVTAVKGGKAGIDVLPQAVNTANRAVEEI